MCPECFSDQPLNRVKDLNQMTCERMIQNPECQDVPGIFKPNCENYGVSRPNMEKIACLASSSVGIIGAGFLGVSALAGLGTLKHATGRKGLLTLVFGGSVGTLYLMHKYYKELEESRSVAKEHGWDEEQVHLYAKGMTLSNIAEKVYNIIFPNNLHCYNRLGAAVRVCGTFAAVAGTGGVVGAAGGAVGGAIVGGVAKTAVGAMAGGFGGGVLSTKWFSDNSQNRENEILKEYEKVQQEVKQKMREADPLISDPDIL